MLQAITALRLRLVTLYLPVSTASTLEFDISFRADLDSSLFAHSTAKTRFLVSFTRPDSSVAMPGHGGVSVAGATEVTTTAEMFRLGGVWAAGRRKLHRVVEIPMMRGR